MIKMIEDRIRTLQGGLDDLKKRTQDLTSKMSQIGDRHQADDLARQISDIQGQTKVFEVALDQARSDLAQEVDRQKSQEYRSAVKRIDQIKVDLDKRQKTIDKTFTDLKTLLDDFCLACKDYDRLHHRCYPGDQRMYGVLWSYGWIKFMKDQIDTIDRDYIYKTRRL